MQKRADLTSADLAVLVSIWPAGSRHSGTAGDVFSAPGRAGRWTVVARRADGSYVIIEEGGRRSATGLSLCELGLPERPIAPAPAPTGAEAAGKRSA